MVIMNMPVTLLTIIDKYMVTNKHAYYYVHMEVDINFCICTAEQSQFLTAQ